MSDNENPQDNNQDISASQLGETTASTVTDSTVTASTQTDKANSAETPCVPDKHTGGDVSEEDEKPEHREHTRSKMALLFVLGFFSILFLCIAYAVKVNASLNELKDILVAIIGALSGTLGFIVGFYYKSIKEQ